MLVINPPHGTLSILAPFSAAAGNIGAAVGGTADSPPGHKRLTGAHIPAGTRSAPALRQRYRRPGDLHRPRQPAAPRVLGAARRIAGHPGAGSQVSPCALQHSCGVPVFPTMSLCCNKRMSLLHWAKNAYNYLALRIRKIEVD